MVLPYFRLDATRDEAEQNPRSHRASARVADARIGYVLAP